MEANVKVKLDISEDKFRGCLLGGLVGDCFGRPYEFVSYHVSKVDLQKFFSSHRALLNYSDDTAMAKGVARSLIERRSFDARDMAQKFAEDFFADQNRGYGGGVKSVFHKLREINYSDVFRPGREQFNGGGSFGNGAAMRVSPMALFFHNDFNDMVNYTKQNARITHAHEQGINGAVLQSLAVLLALNSQKPLVVEEYLYFLTDTMKSIEEKADSSHWSVEVCHPFTVKLGIIGAFLEKGDASDEEVVKLLGNDVSAIGAVPTAVYAFLRAQKCIKGIETDDPFQRTIQYAISLGGDTDTIASMAGAIAGAYCGMAQIKLSLLQCCEGTHEVIKLADELCRACNKL